MLMLLKISFKWISKHQNDSDKKYRTYISLFYELAKSFHKKTDIVYVVGKKDKIRCKLAFIETFIYRFLHRIPKISTCMREIIV
jgi:hypothetical protein